MRMRPWRIRRFHLVFLTALAVQYSLTLWWESPPERGRSPTLDPADRLVFVARLPEDPTGAFSDPSSLFSGAGAGFSENTWERSPAPFESPSALPPNTPPSIQSLGLQPGWLFLKQEWEPDPLDGRVSPPAPEPEYPIPNPPPFPKTPQITKQGALKSRPFVREPELRGEASSALSTSILLTVAQDGTVLGASVTQSCGNPQLDLEATNALKASRFAPSNAPGLAIGRVLVSWEISKGAE